MKAKNILWVRYIFLAVFLLLTFLGINGTGAKVSIAIIILAFVIGNFFCGWICPLGAIQEFSGKFGSLFIKKKLKLPSKAQRYAQFLRYFLMLVIIVFAIIGLIDRGSINATFIDAHMPFQAIMENTPLMVSVLTTGILLGLIFILSFFIDRPYCNYFCTHAVKHAIPSFFRIFSIKRNAEKCVNCKICDRKCPMNIQISKNFEVRNLQCINCFSCINICPIEKTISYGKVDSIFKKLWKKIKHKEY